MKNLLTYLKERFPLPVTGVHSVITAMFLVALAAPSAKNINDILTTLAIALSFLFFMLRMRVTDEFKDASHDSANYPDRPVQRGLITKSTLVNIGVISLIIELSSVSAAAGLQQSPDSPIFYGLIFAYSVLTGFEFFIPKFLDKHFNLYFILHQGIFVLYPVWVFNIFGTQINFAVLLGSAIFVLYMAAMEIMRKYELRYNPAGEVVLDTYLAVWKSAAFWLMYLISVVSPIVLFTYFNSAWLLGVASFAGISLIIIRKKNDLVRAVVALSFIATGIVIYLA